MKGKVFPQDVNEGASVNGRGGDVNNGRGNLQEGGYYEVYSQDREAVTLTEKFKVGGPRGEDDRGGGIDIVNERLAVMVVAVTNWHFFMPFSPYCLNIHDCYPF